jgi:tRNA-intron endonuclease
MMQGALAGEKVLVARVDAERLELKGYGRRVEKGSGRREREEMVSLSIEEAAYLLETEKLELKTEQGAAMMPEAFFTHALTIHPNFVARYIVYKDLRERGYVVQPGVTDFLLYPRGTKQGEKSARYFIRIVSERDSLSMKELVELLKLAQNMRKEAIIAVVDDDSAITYYEVKEAKFNAGEPREAEGEGLEAAVGTAHAFLRGDKVVVRDAPVAERLFKTGAYGALTKEQYLLLSLVEAAYLLKRGVLQLKLAYEAFLAHAAALERDFMLKYAVYADLREKGLVLKAGLKFGSHFRVYRAVNQKHSVDLIHVLPEQFVFSLPELARAVRLAHGVKKRMIFAQLPSGAAGGGGAERGGPPEPIRYVAIGRLKL